ncbi:MAG TPA: hypothetical protein VH092_06670 [Urbifossiella sp.]|jgi:hypothetical protein|nr:hypothetical protein [Urbifossiella sp.]
MPRLAPAFALLLVAAPGAARAQEPEKLLSPTTQLFVRWDGVGPHKAAYAGSALGAAFQGPTGDSARAMLARLPKMLGSELLSGPLLEGKPPAELKAVHADLKAAEQALDLLLDKGVIVAAEVTEPRPTLGGVGRALGGLLGGKAPAPESFLPDVRVLVVVPDAADRANVVFGTLRILMTQGRMAVEPLPPAVGRTGFFAADPDKGNPVRMAWWVEGKHVVFYAGTAEPATAARDLAANAKAGGVTGHPLFQRCLKTGEFESVARGFVDAGSVVSLAKRLAGPFVPGLGEKLDAVGIGNLKAVVFSSGFQGKESRALYEIDLPGERKGLARVLKQSPVTAADLPPLPPDVSRFSLLRVDYAGTYDALLSGYETLADPDDKDDAKDPAEARRRRRLEIERELTKSLGINPGTDLVPFLGDKLCVFQSPTEGLSVFGTVVCVSVTDPGRARAAADQLTRGLETLAGGRAKIRKRVVAGSDTREIYNREFGLVTPTYAVVGDWLVIGGTPQCVQGFALRHAGRLPKWAPDAATAARLAGMPSDAVGLQYCHPRSTVQNLCCIAPLVLGQFGQFSERNSPEFNPTEIGLIPNGHELSGHLFPNLTFTRDDGRTVRIDVRESFSLPLEFIGFEPLAFAFTLGLR